jgi:hypothetical protein
MDKLRRAARAEAIRDAIETVIALLVSLAIFYVIGIWLWRMCGG